jgi:hypothetical protein
MILFRYCIDLIVLLASLMQIEGNYQIVTSSDKKYGGTNADGTWNGMIGDLLAEVRDYCFIYY